MKRINYGLPPKLREFAMKSTRMHNKLYALDCLRSRFDLDEAAVKSLLKLSRAEIENLDRNLIRATRAMLEKVKP